MEVKVSNVSKLAPRETLKTLFGMLGTVLVFEYYPDIIKRDGSYECDIVYSNIHEAKRAIRLSNTTLGDRAFTVTLQKDHNRFRNSRTSSRMRSLIKSDDIRTAILWALPTGCKEDDIKNICGGEEMVESLLLLDKEKEALVEFKDRNLMKLVFERLRVATFTSGHQAKFEEAWKLVDPDYYPAKNLVTDNQKKKRSHSRSSSRSKSRSRSERGRHNGRSRSRSRDRRGSHHYRSRSRSTERVRRDSRYDRDNYHRR